jgi:hypothetical protein
MASMRIAGVDDAELAAGVALHHRTDDAFHHAPIFLSLMGAAQDALEEAGLAHGPAMAVGHVGVELLLDGWLARAGQELGADEAQYRAALELEDPAIRWRPEEGTARWQLLRGRLLKSPLPGAYGDPGFVAERLVWILNQRPRLAVDEAGAELIAAWAPEAAPLVAARGAELMTELRVRLEAAG